jgi:DNA polymerase-3 subunit gamma/tau
MSQQPYLVLARKYRPQRFADLTGQEHVVRTLLNALKTGRVAHALLFTGPRGCGKTTSARILARALNCVGADGQRKEPNPEPCGACTPCLEIAAGNDVDVQEIDAASNNGVDDVRALREAAKYLPARDRYKVYIVDEVHMLSGAAFNALLKTLEEPPGHIKFLLATTDPQKLPATILSRVQRQNIQLVPLGKIVTRLREIAQAEAVLVSDGALSLVARQAQGSMRDALSLLDQLLSSHDPAAGEVTDAEAADALGALDRSIVAAAVAAVLARDAAAALQAVHRAYEQGADFRRFGEELAAHARNLAVAALPGVQRDLPDHEVRALALEAAGHEPAQLARVFELLQNAQEAIGKSPQPRAAVEVALLRAVYLAPSGALPELLSRVDALAQRLGGGAAPSRAPGAAGSPATAPTAAQRDPAQPRGLESGPPRGPVALSLSPEAAPQHQPPSPRPLHLVEAPKSAPAAPASSAPAAPTSSAPAAPTSSAPAAPTRQGLAEALPLEQVWPLLIESVKATRKMAAAAQLEHGVPLELTQQALVVGFKKGRAGMLEEREVRGAVETAFERVLGRRVILQIAELPPEQKLPAGSPAAPAVSSVAEQKERASSQRSEQRRQLGREHPNVRAAVELLSGELEDVKDLGEE